GTKEQKDRWLVPLLEARIRSAFLMTEPDVASSDATNIAMRCERDGDDYVLNGEKWWASGAGDPRCAIYIVMVATPDAGRRKHEQHSMILVPADAPAYRAWMFRIVRNAAIDELRRRREQVSDSAIVPDIWGFDEACIAKITVGQGLTALSAAHREIIGLIDIAGFSYAEAAALLDLPPGTVMSRLARARSLLLAAIEASTVRPMKANKGRRS
ncbi:MAG: hypothetical protein DPW22_09760, partial [Alphaproteobacteria bacterium]|nr:hypothetical protein [Alphaproteobacteria bacterium]